MEQELHKRERAGVADAVLLEDYKSENTFIENLEKRFNENIIYVREVLGWSDVTHTLLSICSWSYKVCKRNYFLGALECCSATNKRRHCLSIDPTN